MKRSTRSFVDKVLRSGKRLFADRFDERAKRMRIISVAFVDSHANKIQIIDCGMEIDDVQIQDFKLAKSKNLNVIETDELLGIVHGKQGIELGESKQTNLVFDDKASLVKRFGVVYTRKRKRTVLYKVYEKKKNKKKVRVGLDIIIKKGPVVFATSCSNQSGDNICWFSCFVGSVLRYLRMTKVFSWGQFSSFLLLEPGSGIYLSTGSRFLQVCYDLNEFYLYAVNKINVFLMIN